MDKSCVVISEAFLINYDICEFLADKHYNSEFFAFILSLSFFYFSRVADARKRKRKKKLHRKLKLAGKSTCRGILDVEVQAGIGIGYDLKLEFRKVKKKNHRGNFKHYDLKNVKMWSHQNSN